MRWFDGDMLERYVLGCGWDAFRVAKDDEVEAGADTWSMLRLVWLQGKSTVNLSFLSFTGGKNQLLR